MSVCVSFVLVLVIVLVPVLRVLVVVLVHVARACACACVPVCSVLCRAFVALFHVASCPSLSSFRVDSGFVACGIGP